jgi:hypothetical protein
MIKDMAMLLSSPLNKQNSSHESFSTFISSAASLMPIRHYCMKKEKAQLFH